MLEAPQLGSTRAGMLNMSWDGQSLLSALPVLPQPISLGPWRFSSLPCLHPDLPLPALLALL